MNTSKDKNRTWLTALVFIALAGGGVALWAHIREAHGQRHDHGHATVEVSALALNNGKRWETDQPLRTGMQRIREAASRVAPVPAQGPLTKEEAKAFATSVQDAVSYMMQHCKLEPKADATLHVLITDLMSGAGLLAENPASAEGAALVRGALQRYPEYFDHPGWKPLAAAEPRS